MIDQKVNKTPKVAVIGAGFAGLSAAAYLAKGGAEVSVYEKNAEVGGRARQLITENGYTFDMGPSWYWMPGVFEQFFGDFGYKPTDFYELLQLNPGFSIVFGQNDVLSIPANMEELETIFENIEKGSAAKLRKFLSGAEFKYKVGMEKLVYKPGLSLSEFLDMDVIRGAFKLQLLQSFQKHAKKYFSHPKLVALMEFPILFLGATAANTPALYSLMNYAGLSLGTWYPKGGFASVIDAMRTVAEKQGVKFYVNEPIASFTISEKNIVEVISANHRERYDGVVASADYHHVENELLRGDFRNYTEEYWDKRMLAPSSLIFYLGLSKKVEKLVHHTLFFDENLNTHANEIYKNPAWPSKPLFYVCCPSKTDETVAPIGHENLFILMPLATGLEDTEELRESYFKLLMNRLEKYTGQQLQSSIDYKQSYCINDFVRDYNSYKGNAYGLANTLMQTANLKPSIKNKKINNLFYAGQLTVPGPGVPPSIISGKLAADQLIITIEKKAMKEKYDHLSAECSRITTLRYSTSFSLGIYFLHKKLRQPIYAIYGFVRLADEIVDSFHEYDKAYLLHKFKADCYEAIGHKISLNPILNSFQQVVNEYQIELDLVDLFLKSMEMDLNEEHYTPDKFDKYILGSAQVVGLMCLRVFTAGDCKNYDRLKESAMLLGSAFQKVNFLRDLNADYRLLNRSYFPNVNIAEFGNAEKQEIEKEIESEFQRALQGIKLLPREARSGVYLAYIYYLELFKKIRNASAEKVVNGRIRISKGHKLGLMFDSLIRYKINAI